MTELSLEKTCNFPYVHVEVHREVHVSTHKLELISSLAKAEHFFNINCILPELAGKYFTCSKAKVSEIELPDTIEQDEGNHCFCKESKGGDMVACDSTKCSIKWFHKSCLQMDTPPREKWICLTCQLKRKRKNEDITS